MTSYRPMPWRAFAVVLVSAVAVSLSLMALRANARAEAYSCEADRIELEGYRRRHFAEPPVSGELRTVYPESWVCAKGKTGRWECWVP